MHRLFTLLAGLAVLAGCDYNRPEDYQAKADYHRYLEGKVRSLEAELAKRGPAGETKAEDPKAALMAAAKTKYQTFCVSCHGADGKANSGAALAMNPKPRNLTDPAWQDGVDDARIYKVLDKGGAAVGLSSSMPAWGAAMSEDELNGLVAYIRSLRGK